MKRALIIGASRGLGRALAEEFATQRWNVVATLRDIATSLFAAFLERIEIFALELDDPLAGASLNAAFPAGSFNLLLVNAGILGPEHQNATRVSPEEISSLFLINAIAPIRLAEACLPLVRPGGVIAFMSSRTASFALNVAGDMALYRASKAALNSLAKSFAVSTALPSGRGVLLLHPCWVQTEMGGADAPVAVGDSAHGLHEVIIAALDHPRFQFIDYLGQTLPG